MGEKPTIVCLHGLGGTPRSVAPIVSFLREAGYRVETPTLLGHGTTPEDLAQRSWQHWLDQVLDRLTQLDGQVVLVGQSMGATLALVAASQSACVIGVAAINAVAFPADPDAAEHFEYLLGRGKIMQPAGAPDIRDCSAVDDAYAQLPITALIELGRGGTQLNDAMDQIKMPVLVISSDHDGVVDPANSDHLAANVGGPVTRTRLANSGHVAALDFDRDFLCEQLLTWLVNLTDSSAVLPDESASS
jgi:carboxylesterase